MPRLSPPLVGLLLVCAGPDASRAAGGGAGIDPGLPVYRGEVERFTLAPGGEVDGLLLTDGTEVEMPPHLSAELTAAVRPGDAVRVHGLKAASLPVVQAVAIEDERTGRAVIDRGASAPLPPPPRPGSPAHLQGRIRLPLHGMRGEVNGLLLDDGTILRIDPAEPSQAGAYRPGSLVVADGESHASPFGTVVRATALGVRPDRAAPGGVR